MKKQTFAFAFIILTLFIGAFNSQAQTYARNGMVVSANKLASEVGADVLKKGGNVIDATVATAFALAVVHPTAGNIGGGGFIVYSIIANLAAWHAAGVELT